MMSKTYMSGMSNFLDALHNPDRSGRYTDNLLASFIMPGNAGMVDRAFDPWIRAHRGLLETIAARTPGFSAALPPVRNRWGDPIGRGDALMLPGVPDPGGAVSRALSPIHVGDGSGEPIDKWIWTNRDAFPQADDGRLGLSPFRKPEIAIEAGGTDVHLKLNNTQMDRLRVLAGNGIKDENGLGAKDSLNALVENRNPNADLQDDWNGASPQARALMVLRIWNASRKAAKMQILREFPDLQDSFAAQAQAQVQQSQSDFAAPTIDR
jgi:hypothetical protein